jgi:hypothetical protein
MTEQAKTREPRKAYSYSWYVPAGSSKGEAAAPPAQVMELTESMEVRQEPDSSYELLNPQPVEATEPIPLIKPLGRMPKPRKQKQRYLGPGILSNRLRIAALVGWSAVAGTGMAALVLLRHGPLITLQVGELAGLWAGLSLALWFFTSRFAK